MTDDLIGQLRTLLETDRSSANPRYPVQARHALKNETVANAIMERLAGNETLINIRPLDYSFSTGLIPVCFEFTRPRIGLGPTALLVLLNSNLEVAGVVDPFDPQQPNPQLPPLPIVGAEPFVLSRPSAAESAAVSQEQLQMRHARVREFFANLKINPRPASEDGTFSQYTTPVECAIESILYKSNRPENSQPDYYVDYGVTDSNVDDAPDGGVEVPP